MSIPQYLRWVKSIFRRARVDLADSQYRQDWWARGVSIAPHAMIKLGQNYSLEIGAGSMIGAYTLIDLSNDALAATPVASKLNIGQRTLINEFNNIRAAGGTVTIGDNCLISQFVTIVASNHSIARDRPMRDQPWDTRRTGVQIGNDVWIGAQAVILPGVTIQTGSIIAAGAVVNSDIPEYAIAMGVPATVKRYR